MSEQLYVGSNGYVAAVDPNSGEVAWRTKLSTGIVSSTSHEDVSILDHEGKLFAGCHGHLFCLNAQSGEILWHNPLDGFGYNDVTLSIAGRSVQAMRKVHQQRN